MTNPEYFLLRAKECLEEISLGINISSNLTLVIQLLNIRRVLDKQQTLSIPGQLSPKPIVYEDLPPESKDVFPVPKNFDEVKIPEHKTFAELYGAGEKSAEISKPIPVDESLLKEEDSGTRANIFKDGRLMVGENPNPQNIRKALDSGTEAVKIKTHEFDSAHVCWYCMQTAERLSEQAGGMDASMLDCPVRKK